MTDETWRRLHPHQDDALRTMSRILVMDTGGLDSATAFIHDHRDREHPVVILVDELLGAPTRAILDFVPSTIYGHTMRPKIFLPRHSVAPPIFHRPKKRRKFKGSKAARRMHRGIK